MVAQLSPDRLMQEPRLRDLSKADRELALAFLDSLSSTRGRDQVPVFRDEWVPLTKANPTPTDVHVSTELTDMSVAYLQDMSNSVAAGQGIIPVRNIAGQFNLYDRGDWMRIDINAARRGAGNESAGGGFKVTQGNYSCLTYAWHKDVDEQLMANQLAGDPTDDATAYVTQQLVMIREAIFVANILKAAIWTGSVNLNGGGAGGDLTGVPGAPAAGQFKQWDQASSTPREDLSTEALGIHQNSGRWPNVLVLSPFVLRGLLLNAEIVSAFQYTTAGATPDLEALAKALIAPAISSYSAPRIVIAGMTNATSAEGVADVMAYMAGKVALLAYVDPRPGLRTPTAWSVFAWESLLGDAAYTIRMKDFELPRNAVPHRVEGEMSFDIRQVAPILGVFFTAAVS